MTMMKDVVCGMGVDDLAPDSFMKIHQGVKYYFCCPECRNLFAHDPESYLRRLEEIPAAARDPVCGMAVDPSNPPYTSLRGERTIYFCSIACKMEFERNPGQYG